MIVFETQLYAGTVKLTGTDKTKIIAESTALLTDNLYYATMAEANNPYGDGKASERIVENLNIQNIIWQKY